jgi:4-hydroxybenzoate polyprenyltransferase
VVILRLIRFPNLVVVALTQWLVATHILGLAFQQAGLSATLNAYELGLLMAATVSLTAAGYAYNDLLDFPIDIINRPERVVIGKQISTSTVYWIIAVLSLTGFGGSLLLALLKEELIWLWLYPFFACLLAWYPLTFKTRPFAGNLLIAGCCAGVAGLVWLAERRVWQLLPDPFLAQVAFILVLFMIYAFLATWIREIIKDLEDRKGDRELGRQTLPVYWGVGGAKVTVWILSLVLGIALCSGILQLNAMSYQLPIAVLSLCLLVWLGILSRQLQKATAPQMYHTLSTQWKFFLLGGLLLLFLYKI